MFVIPWFVILSGGDGVHLLQTPSRLFVRNTSIYMLAFVSFYVHLILKTLLVKIHDQFYLFQNNKMK